MTRKKTIVHGLFILIFTATIIQSCKQADNDVAQGSWIKGTEEEKINTIEKQFRGFDNAYGRDRLPVPGTLLGRT